MKLTRLQYTSALLFVFGLITCAYCATDECHWSIMGPTSVTFDWRTTGNSVDDKTIYYGTTSVNLTSSVTLLPLYVWVVDGMQRIAPDAPAGTAALAVIYAARREWEPFQVIVQAGADGLTNVNMTVSDLTGPNGRISKNNITLYREQYIHVTKGSPTWRGPPNLPLGAGFYPDGLIPFVDPDTGQDIVGANLDAVPFTLTAYKNAPLFVDVFVPPDANTGTYTGTCTVTSNQGSAQVQVELHVRNFELPERPSMRSIFLDGGDEALKHKLMDSSYYPLTNTIDAGFWSGAYYDHCDMSAAPTPQQFANVQALYPTEMWPYLVNYTADEISDCTGLYPAIKQWARNMHSASDIKQLIVMMPVPDLYDDGSGTGRPAVDIWVLLPEQDNDQTTHSRLQYTMSNLGCEGWTYNCLVQDNFSPKWEIDFRPIEFRIQPWINQKYGYNGLLYWSCIQWGNETNVWYSSPSGYPNYPGEGQLIYPGGEIGISGEAPSMRLKWLREGVEDYEYIQILKNLGDTTFAITQINLVGPDWTSWTRDTSVLYNARKTLGDRIELIGALGPDPMTWASAPVAETSTTVTMTATTATAISGVEYFFHNVTDPNHDSGWQDSPIYTDTSLIPDANYEYQVKAGDKSDYHNETAYSATASARTLACSSQSVLFSDDFEDYEEISTVWNVSDTRYVYITDETAYTGIYSVIMKTASWIKKQVSTVGYSNIHVQYARKVNGTDPYDDGEYLYAEWSVDGINWNALEQTQQTRWVCKDFVCDPNADNNPNFQVRFRTTANLSAEYVYVDSVKIYVTSMPGDINADGVVDFFDFAEFAAHWDETGCSEPDWCDGANLNKTNNYIDFADLNVLAEYWLEGL